MIPTRLSAWVAQARLSTPLGEMTLATTARGLAGVWMDGQKHHPGELRVPMQPEHTILHLAAQDLQRYWSQPQAAWSVPLDPQGSAFQLQVWAALRGIACGHTVSYGALAAALGRASAARAVGAAVGRNPLSVIVPCHRVVGAAGALTGYAGGLDRKRWLLHHESAETAAHNSRKSNTPKRGPSSVG